LQLNRYSQALALQEQAADLDPDFPCPHRVLSTIYRMQGRIELSRNAMRKGTASGNPRCLFDRQLLAQRIGLDAAVASQLSSDLEQARTVMRNGVQFLFAGPEEPTRRMFREGFTGSREVSPASLPAGWVWGSEAGGLPGTLDPSTRGGSHGSGLTAPDAATSGSGGMGSE